jgi:hypothetical protein
VQLWLVVMVKAKSVKKEPKSAKAQRSAAARLAEDADDDTENIGPSQPASQRPSQKQKRGAPSSQQPSQRGGRAWGATSNVAAALQPHVKRAFIQAMMVHECLPQDAPLAGGKAYDTWATKIYEELSGAPDSTRFTDFLADCNANLAILEFSIRRVLFPATNTWFVALVNDTADESSKMLTAKYSIAEVAYFRSLVETLAASEECDIDGVPHIKATDALNLDVDLPTGTEAVGMTQASQASQARRQLSMDAKQSALGRLTEDGWMARSTTRKGFGIIGPRTFMALGSWLMGMDVPERTRDAWEKLV